MNVAVDGIDARTREGRRARRAATVEPEVERPAIDVGEDVVAERILIRETDRAAGEDDAYVRNELAPAHRDRSRPQRRDVARRDHRRPGGRLEVDDGVSQIAAVRIRTFLEREHAAHRALGVGATDRRRGR